jgi:hypothetical protein
MDVKTNLLNDMNVIVSQIIKRNSFSTDYEIMNECFKLIENDIEMNFDSQKLYFLSYSMMDKHELYFEYFKNPTPGITSLIKSLIETNIRMSDNIKNKHHRIHFRVFKDNILLEDSENDFRVEFFKQLTMFLNQKEYLFKYLMGKLLEYEKQIIDDQGNDTDIEPYVVLNRIQVILSKLAKHIYQCD